MNSPLFQRQATGGAIARDGFEYQDAYLLEQLPALLTHSAFSYVVSECLGDIEFRYHRPGGGTFCVAVEAKGEQLAVSAVWDEIACFVEMHEASPGEFVRFVLVCSDYAGVFTPLFNKLDRLRGVAASLNADSAILVAARQEVEDAIVEMKQTAAMARFVRERVSFVKYSDANVSGAFNAAVGGLLPVASDMGTKQVATFLEKCKALVAQSIKGVVLRHDIEAALLESAPSLATDWRSAPSVLQLLAAPPPCIEQLWLDVGKYNGNDRGRLGSQAWSDLQVQIRDVADFLQASRARSAVALSPKQRVSVATTVGYCLSATRGFTLQMEHNAGAVFDTARHERGDGPFFKTRDESGGSGPEGVVSISFPYPGRQDIAVAGTALGLAAAPQLHIESTDVIDGLPALNTAVNEAKAAVVAFRAAHQLQVVHLFLKTPSVFAMALGHRLNGVGPVQLYDWVVNEYRPTSRLTQ